MRSFLTTCACLLAGVLACVPFAAPAQAQARVAVGSLERLAMVPSKFIDPRPVEVWLPEGYADKARAGKRFKVLYMHDGQMLFDASTTWNKTAWNVHEVLARLVREGKVADTIIVGVFNIDKQRYIEYFPQKFLDEMTPAARGAFLRDGLKGSPQADNYLRFLVQELKPLVDARYATRTGPLDTVTMGASMGGLISVYAMAEYPQVFGGAAGLSTHWPGTGKPNALLPLAAYNYLNRKLPAPQGHRLYQDHGDQGLDALYAPYQRFVDQIVRDAGYTDAHYLSKVYPGEDHNEKAWNRRLEVPLVFLLGEAGK
ncbi:alpha/beta hydrolase [Massilia sp. SYSU DXS3249]